AVTPHGYFRYELSLDESIDPGLIFGVHVKWGEMRAGPLEELARPHANARQPDRVLKVGYVSGDFRKHSVAYFFEPLLEAHDRAHVHVRCYSAAVLEDDVTRRMKQKADAWREIGRLSNDDAAQLIRSDGIDVLVDLSGHS